MNRLKLYGWNEELFRQKRNSNYKDFLQDRVTVTHKTCYEVVSGTGHYICELTGNMLYGREVSEYPCTGDWVIFQSVYGKPKTTRDKIIDLLRRNHKFSAAALAAQTGISRKGVEKHLANLKAAGILRGKGPDKGGRWEALFVGSAEMIHQLSE